MSWSRTVRSRHRFLSLPMKPGLSPKSSRHHTPFLVSCLLESPTFGRVAADLFSLSIPRQNSRSLRWHRNRLLAGSGSLRPSSEKRLLGPTIRILKTIAGQVGHYAVAVASLFPAGPAVLAGCCNHFSRYPVCSGRIRLLLGQLGPSSNCGQQRHHTRPIFLPSMGGQVRVPKDGEVAGIRWLACIRRCVQGFEISLQRQSGPSNLAVGGRYPSSHLLRGRSVADGDCQGTRCTGNLLVPNLRVLSMGLRLFHALHLPHGKASPQPQVVCRG